MHGNQLDFHVRDGLVHKTALTQYENRGEYALELLQDLVLNWPGLFEGREGSVFYGDRPPPDDLAIRTLNFCSTRRVSDPGPWLPFPCPYALRWPQIGVPDAEAMMDRMLEDGREWDSPKIFWIGTLQHPSRGMLAELGKKHPEVLDVELMEWRRANPKALVSKSRQVSLPDHRLFKYLADCPGRGYSGRLKWLLATGRPVFVVERDIVEPWHVEMEPWVHFVPVAADLSDLLEHHARLEAEPDLYAEISRNGRAFAGRSLRLEEQLVRVAESVREVLGSSPEAARRIGNEDR